MKKRGFTLVELLAVIAILAILVIVAMPNVLGMFNQAKVNSFMTEIQKMMDTAITTFTKDALLNSGKTVYYSNVDNATLGTKQLDMSGNKKNYFIEMDRNGKFKRVLIYDDNYCYDVYSRNGEGYAPEFDTNSIVVSSEITKNTVSINNIWESGNDEIDISERYHKYIVKGCEANINIDNEKLKVLTIEGLGNYLYEDGMTWEQWVNSGYNIDEVEISGNKLYFTKVENIGIIRDGVTIYDRVILDADSCHYYKPTELIDNTLKIETDSIFIDC